MKIINPNIQEAKSRRHTIIKLLKPWDKEKNFYKQSKEKDIQCTGKEIKMTANSQ